MYCGRSKTFTCTGNDKEFLWNITGLRGIDIPGPFFLRKAVSGNNRMSSSDSGEKHQFDKSVITIWNFSAADNGGTIQCIYKEGNSSSVQGTATISISTSMF